MRQQVGAVTVAWPTLRGALQVSQVTLQHHTSYFVVVP